MNDDYLNGRRLWGDDFEEGEIVKWFEDEREAYALQLGGADEDPGAYGYEVLNQVHGWRQLPAGQDFESVLGVGSAHGGEFAAMAARLGRITLLEPSQNMISAEIAGKPLTYVSPQASGIMPFGDGAFDLVTSFGVLHHIPNVSLVVREMVRVTKAGGFILIREPSISMGDWRRSRGAGITARERGIPPALMTTALTRAGATIMRSAPCMFPTTGRLGHRFPKLGYSSRVGVALDTMLCTMFAWNHRYHAVRPWQKIRPTNMFYVARKV